MKRVQLKAFPSVQLAVHGLGQYRVINTVEQAAETLLERWPTTEGKAFETAVQTCLDAMEGRAKPGHVREALLKAAEESNIHFRDSTG